MSRATFLTACLFLASAGSAFALTPLPVSAPTVSFEGDAFERLTAVTPFEPKDSPALRLVWDSKDFPAQGAPARFLLSLEIQIGPSVGIKDAVGGYPSDIRGQLVLGPSTWQVSPSMSPGMLPRFLTRDGHLSLVLPLRLDPVQATHAVTGPRYTFLIADFGVGRASLDFQRLMLADSFEGDLVSRLGGAGLSEVFGLAKGTAADFPHLQPALSDQQAKAEKVLAAKCCISTAGWYCNCAFCGPGPGGQYNHCENLVGPRCTNCQGDCLDCVGLLCLQCDE